MRYYTRVPFGLVVIWKVLGFIGIVVVVVVGGCYRLLVGEPRRSPQPYTPQSYTPQPQYAAYYLAPADVELGDLTLVPARPSYSERGTAVPYEMTGRVKNRSYSGPLKEVTLQVTMSDCPLKGKGTCDVIGDETVVVKVDVPPGQVRALNARVRFAALPQTRGRLSWNFRMISARGDDRVEYR